jgi:uncharacterized phage infection (PIP) family protein YhgE
MHKVTDFVLALFLAVSIVASIYVISRLKGKEAQLTTSMEALKSESDALIRALKAQNTTLVSQAIASKQEIDSLETTKQELQRSVDTLTSQVRSLTGQGTNDLTQLLSGLNEASGQIKNKKVKKAADQLLVVIKLAQDRLASFQKNQETIAPELPPTKREDK